MTTSRMLVQTVDVTAMFEGSDYAVFAISLNLNF